MSTLSFRFLSWNLKDFGKFNYEATMNQIADTMIKSGADIVVVLEVAVNRSGKRTKMDADILLDGATEAIDALLAELRLQDPVSGWTEISSGANAGNKQRDAYAFYYKSTPAATAPPAGFLRPVTITLKNGPTILTQNAANKPLGFSNSRKPGACVFEFSNPAANPAVEQAIVCGFHAYAKIKKDKTGAKRKAAISDCVKAMLAPVQNGFPNIAKGVVGGDFNLDYDKNIGFYGGLPFQVGITENGASSLTPKPDFTVNPPVVADSAYDNFLFSRGLLSMVKAETKVINVVEEITDKLMAKAKPGVKRSRMAEQAFNTHYVQEGADEEVASTSSISDHFPIIGSFTF